MGFNKRCFNIEMLVKYYMNDPIKGIETAIGKTDVFIFCDEESQVIIDLWVEGKIKETKEILNQYVPRIGGRVV